MLDVVPLLSAPRDARSGDAASIWRHLPTRAACATVLQAGHLAPHMQPGCRPSGLVQVGGPAVQTARGRRRRFAPKDEEDYQVPVRRYATLRDYRYAALHARPETTQILTTSPSTEILLLPQCGLWRPSCRVRRRNR